MADDGYGSQPSLAPTDFSKVCARTCGIRVKRIADYSDFEVESGELTDSESELDVCGDVPQLRCQPLPPLRCQPLPQSDVIQAPLTPLLNTQIYSSVAAGSVTDVVFSSSRPNHCKRKMERDEPIRIGRELYTIQQQLMEDPLPSIKFAPSTLEELLVHRSPVASDSESEGDREGVFSSSDSDYCDPTPTMIDMRIAELNLEDHANKEKFPHIELLDITLNETEQIHPFGEITQIVDDFVVIKSAASFILDEGSMVFNKDRCSVGYVFEVLGLVSAPYYSIRYNKSSEIVERGLEIGQELYYSRNENYTRVLIVDKLTALEKQKYNKEPKLYSDSSESEGEGKPKEAWRPKLKARRPQMMVNRPPATATIQTHNYSMNYQATPPAWPCYDPNNYYPTSVYQPHHSVSQPTTFQAQPVVYSHSKPPPPPGPPPPVIPPPAMFAPLPPSEGVVISSLPGLYGMSVYDSDAS